jgi:hypothetical protein
MNDAKKTIRITSLLHRAYWRVWQETTGKTVTFDELHDPKHVRKIAAFVKEFLPDVRRLAKGENNVS